MRRSEWIQLHFNLLLLITFFLQFRAHERTACTYEPNCLRQSKLICRLHQSSTSRVSLGDKGSFSSRFPACGRFPRSGLGWKLHPPFSAATTLGDHQTGSQSRCLYEANFAIDFLCLHSQQTRSLSFRPLSEDSN